MFVVGGEKEAMRARRRENKQCQVAQTSLKLQRPYSKCSAAPVSGLNDYQTVDVKAANRMLGRKTPTCSKAFLSYYHMVSVISSKKKDEGNCEPKSPPKRYDAAETF